MIDQIQQTLSRKAARLVRGLDRRLKKWAASHIRADSSGSVSSGKGLLQRHGIDLSASAEELDQQFADSGEGVLVRRYPQRVVASEDGTLNTEQMSTSGVTFRNDRPSYEDENTTYQPVKVRGRATRRGHGLYHQMWLTSSAYQRAWGTPLQGLITGEWSVHPPDLVDPTDRQVAAGQRRAAKLQQALIKNLDGGWQKYVTEWLYALVAGFTVHERIFQGVGAKAGLIDRLSFIYPSSVDGWILDEAGQRLQAVRFKDADSGSEYVLEAGDLQLYSHLRLGLNFEGVSTLRSITGWIQTIHLIQQLENLTKERLGVPWITVQKDGNAHGNTNSNTNSNEDDLESILESARAEESPVIELPNGTSLELHSAAGQEPDFEAPKKFAVEQVKQRLNAEGSLIAVGDTGAHAAREDASKDALQIAAYLADLMCENLNGDSNTPYTGVVPDMERAHWGGPIQPGRYCQLDWSPGESRNPQRAEKINKGLKSGALIPGPSVEGAYREEVGLPLTHAQEKALADGPDSLDEEEPSEHEAEPVAAAEKGCGCDETHHRQGPLDGITAAEVVAAGGVHIKASSLDPEKTTRLQDRLEQQLANRLEEVATAHKQAYRDRVRDKIEGVTDRAAAKRVADQAKDRVREQFRPKYREAALEVLQKAKDKGGQDLIRVFGETIGQQTEIPVDADIQAIIEDEADQLADEALNRQQGRFNSRINDMLSGDKRVSLPKLAGSTWLSMASTTVSKPYNLGRDAVVKKAQKNMRRGLPGDGAAAEIIAERSSVLDGDTCETCEDLDGARALVGSDRYADISPPNQCEGGGRCRCIFSYILPDERGFREAVEEIKQ